MAGKATKNARADARTLDDSRKKQKSTKTWTQLDRYKRLIKERMTALKIYKPQYAALIDRTARLYVKLDELETEYDKAGRERFVEYTNKAGATNLVPNPYLKAIQDVYAELLAHERELGLTPAALRKIGEVSAPPQKSVIELAFEKLRSG